MSKYVTFDEYASFPKSKNNYANENHEEEQENPRTTEPTRPLSRDIEKNLYHKIMR